MRTGAAAARAHAPAALVTALSTALALVAFAANSVLCRSALGAHAIDAGSFTLVRLASGAALLLLLRAGARPRARLRLDAPQPAMLLAYAAAFSFAYTRLGAGTGALVLFGSVQVTMIANALRSGERMRRPELAGLALALAGLACLVAPGVTAPSVRGVALMAVAGVAWGVYSLRGRGSADPLGETARNFALAAPLSLLLLVPALGHAHVTSRGVLLAALSGAITSGLGYVVWFAALRGLPAIRAAIVQLAVPAIAAGGGVLVLGERITPRLVGSALLILGGVGLAIATHARAARR